MNGMFDPTPEEQEENRQAERLQRADYSFVTIPAEVKDAYRAISTARFEITRLGKYSRLSPAMKYDLSRATALLTRSETIVRRFFATAETINVSGIPNS